MHGDLRKERDEARAEVERLRAEIDALPDAEAALCHCGHSRALHGETGCTWTGTDPDMGEIACDCPGYQSEADALNEAMVEMVDARRGAAGAESAPTDVDAPSEGTGEPSEEAEAAAFGDDA